MTCSVAGPAGFGFTADEKRTRSPIPGHTLPHDLAVANADDRAYDLTVRIERKSTIVYDQTVHVLPKTAESESWYTQNLTYPSKGTYDVFVELDNNSTDAMAFEAPDPGSAIFVSVRVGEVDVVTHYV